MPSITIKIPINEIILSNGEHDGYETESFEYDYDWGILAEEIITIFCDEYKITRAAASEIIDNFDLWDELEEQYEDALYDALHERLYAEACKAYKEACEAYNGGDYY